MQAPEDKSQLPRALPSPPEPQGFSFGKGQIFAAVHEAPTALPSAFITL